MPAFAGMTSECSPHSVREGGKRGAPEGRFRLQFQGSLQAPRARRYIEPLPLAYRLFRGQRNSCRQRWTQGFPTRAGGRRAPEVVRYTGRSG